MSTPERIGIRELRQHASRWVALAEEGHRVEITNRGRLVAALVPATEREDVLDRLEREGLLVRRGDSDWSQLPEPIESDVSLSEVLQQMRDEDRERW